MKKLLLNIAVWVPIISLTLLVFKYINHSAQSDWKTYQKENETIVKHETTQNEKLEAKLPKKSSGQHERDFPKHQNRRIINLTNKELFWDEITFSNKVNPHWKDSLATNLLSMQKPDTKVFIKEELQLIKVSKGSARYLERVIITYLKESGMRSSFTAYVDSQTGKVIETWGRTRFETLRRTLVE